MNINTSTGYDNVPAIVLVKCAVVLCVPLSNLFNLSLSRGVYPSALKYNNLIPIYKKGPKRNVENYRGISIMPVVAKLFERLVNASLRKHIRFLICDEQHGFLAGRSTVTNLTLYTDFLSKCLDEKSEVHSIYTDFCKAFDVVSFDLLLLKMQKQFGIDGISLAWFRSYLTDRFQRVTLSGMESEWFNVLSGVPQGSILGPTLFLMFVNDLPSILTSSCCLLFADDAKVFMKINNVNDCKRLQSDIDSLSSWCNVWKINLNISKCMVMKFSLKRSLAVNFVYFICETVLPSVNEIKDLGVIFTSNLCFNKHITTITKKSFQLVGFLRRVLKLFKNRDVCITMFNSLIRSRLEYCSVIWSPSAKHFIDKIERVQKKYLKFMCFKFRLPYDVPYPSLCKSFKFQPLYHRRNICDLVTFNKILTNKLDCSPLLESIDFNVPPPPSSYPVTRRRIHYTPPCFRESFRINIRKNSPLVRCQHLANSTGLDMFDVNLYHFKKSARHFYDIG